MSTEYLKIQLGDKYTLAKANSPKRCTPMPTVVALNAKWASLQRLNPSSIKRSIYY